MNDFYFIGVDVSKKKLDFCVLHENRIIIETEVTNHQGAIMAFISNLESEFGIDVGQHFQNILSGDKDFTNKTILNTNTLGFERAFLLIHICRCLYFITFYLKNRHFCPPNCPRDKKGTKKYVPRVFEAQTRD